MHNTFISAVVLAAGQSKRMGTAKMVLPWGSVTVIGQVVSVLSTAGLAEIIVVTGGASQQVEQALEKQPVRFVHNDRYDRTEMLESLQLGLSSVSPPASAALVVLGDQPQIEAGVIRQVLYVAGCVESPLVIPSYQKHRGHPWLVRRLLWPEILALRSPATLRDFLNDHAGQIQYIDVNTPSILQDLDTPEDYQQTRPNS